ESEDHAIRMAEIIKGVTRSLGLPLIFKASYDKANRTSIKSYRGPGLTQGLLVLGKVRDQMQVPILTDVHETIDVPKVAEVADILQIPAFLWPDRPGGRGRQERARGQHQERPICFAVGYETCRRQVSRRRELSRVRHRARLQLRLQQPGS